MTHCQVIFWLAYLMYSDSPCTILRSCPQNTIHTVGPTLFKRESGRSRGAMTQAQFWICVPMEIQEPQTANAGELDPPAYDWQRASYRDAGFPLPLTMSRLGSATTDVRRPVTEHVCGISSGKGLLRAVFEVSGAGKRTIERRFPSI
jgi:hypothetical protein